MKFLYPCLMVFLASTSYAQKTQIADTLITATDTLIFKKDTVKLSKVDLLIRQANNKQAKPVEAIQFYKKALLSKTKDKDSTWVGDVRFAMAKMYFKLNNSNDGFLNLLAAQSLYTQAMNNSCQSAVTREIAEIYESNNDWVEAEKYYQLAFKQQEAVGLFLDMPYTLNALANGYYKRKDYVNAEKYYAAALNQFELNGEKNKRAETIVNLADIKVKQKNYAQAEHLILKRAMPFFSSVGKPEAKVACFNMLGDIYYTQSRLSEAKWFYIQAYTSYQNAGDVAGVVRSIVNLAKVKVAIGDKKAAYKDFKDAEAMALKSKNLPLVADVKVAYARYYAKPKAATTLVAANKTTSDVKDAKVLAAKNDSLTTKTPVVAKKIAPANKSKVVAANKTGITVKKDSSVLASAVKTKSKPLVVAAQIKPAATPAPTVEKMVEEKSELKTEVIKDETVNSVKN